MIWQQRMQRLASHLRQHSPLPARLVWDGQAIDFGLFEQPLVTMHIRSPPACAICFPHGWTIWARHMSGPGGYRGQAR
jgi:hypothetical protein